MRTGTGLDLLLTVFICQKKRGGRALKRGGLGLGSGSGSDTEWLKGGRDGKTIMVSIALVSKKESYKRILYGSDFVLFWL